MARQHAEAGTYYRAVNTRRFDSGKEVTYVYGPYATRAPAKGRITLHEGLAKQSRGKWRTNPFSAVGHIETTEVDWQRESAEGESHARVP